MKSCFEELHTFFYQWGAIFLSKSRRTEQAECKRIFKQLRDFMVKKVHFLLEIYVYINS